MSWSSSGSEESSDSELWDDEEPLDPAARAEVNGRAPINQLPTETFDAIFELVGAVGTMHPIFSVDVNSLRSASVVCRQWKESAQRALALQLSFYGTSREGIQQWLSLPFEMALKTQYLLLSEVESKLVDSVLRRCRSITKLRLISGGVHQEDWSFFRLPCFSNLRWLEMDNDAIWDDPTDTSPLSLPLEVLKIHFYVTYPKYSHLFRALFTGAASTLRYVDISQWDLLRPYAHPEFWSQLPLLSNSLEHLYFSSLDSNQNFALPQLHKLKALTFGELNLQTFEVKTWLSSIAPGQIKTLKTDFFSILVTYELLLTCPAFSALENLFVDNGHIMDVDEDTNNKFPELSRFLRKIRVTAECKGFTFILGNEQ
ncbi:hypothetical protein T439DRAFT_329201 [Meredithblackwellia eburnea MCA 4105]